jgi:hypothetical protein
LARASARGFILRLYPAGASANANIIDTHVTTVLVPKEVAQRVAAFAISMWTHFLHCHCWGSMFAMRPQQRPSPSPSLAMINTMQPEVSIERLTTPSATDSWSAFAMVVSRRFDRGPASAAAFVLTSMLHLSYLHFLPLRSQEGA